MLNKISGINSNLHKTQLNLMAQTIQRGFNVQIGHIKSPVNISEMILISNVLTEHRSFLSKHPLNDIVKAGSDELCGSYDVQLKRVAFNCKNKFSGILNKILRHELAHHLSLDAFSLENWMDLARLNSFKVLDGDNLVELKIASKQQLLDISELNSWFIVVGNKILAYCSEEQIPSPTIAFQRVNDATKDLSVKTGLQERDIEIHLTNGNRFKNILEMVADDLTFYIKDPQNYEKAVTEASKNNAVNLRAMTHEMEFFKRFFPHS